MRSMEMQDSHIMKTRETIIRMASDHGNSGVSGISSDSAIILIRRLRRLSGRP